MQRVTLDTNILPPDECLEVATGLDFEFSVVTVTEREVAGTSLEVSLKELKSINETAVWGESMWGQAVWGPAVAETFILDESRLGEGRLGDEQQEDLFELSLKIISNGAFPKPGKRDELTTKQRKQLRDAMILTAHLREGRGILVTNDSKAFINHGRREELEKRFKTKIMTKSEFLKFCQDLRNKT